MLIYFDKETIFPAFQPCEVSLNKKDFTKKRRTAASKEALSFII